MDILQFNLDEIERWLLMLFRVSSMMMVMPLFGYTSFPVRMRLGLAFMVTSLLFTVHPNMELILGSGILYFFAAILKEVAVGVAIALASSFFVYGFLFAGEIISRTIGFSIINVMDPQSEQQVPIIGQMLNMTVLILFLLVNGHHFLLMAIDESFLRIPLGAGVFPSALVEGLARLSADIFVLGVKVAAPVLVTVLLAEFVLGFLARTVPQMNVWILGFPLKVGLGLLTLALSLQLLTLVFTKYYAGWQGSVIDFLRAVAGM